MTLSSRALIATGLLICCIIIVPYAKNFVDQGIETYRTIRDETEASLATFESCDVCHQKGYVIHPACLFCVPQIPPQLDHHGCTSDKRR